MPRYYYSAKYPCSKNFGNTKTLSYISATFYEERWAIRMVRFKIFSVASIYGLKHVSAPNSMKIVICETSD